jgi:hypothetical protein
LDISSACKTVRAWGDLLRRDAEGRREPESLSSAVGEIRRYLELAVADGRPLVELAVGEHLLSTPEGIRWVMPFVLSAEGIEAGKIQVAAGLPVRLGTRQGSS